MRTSIANLAGTTPIGRAEIKSLATYVPPRVLTNADLEKLAGGNVLRALRKAEEVATRLRKERPASTATIEELDGPRPAAESAKK